MRVLLSAALLLSASCGALWSGDSIPNPRNCVVNPGACEPTESCDLERQICVPTDSVVLREASPSLVPRGAAMTQVALSGSGFQRGARVFLGSDPIEVNVLGEVEEDRIRIHVPASPSSCGPVPVRVLNPDGTSATSSALLRYVLASVRPQISQHLGSAGAGATAVTIAQLSGDSRPDIAVALRGQRRIDVFDQSSSGMFQSVRPAIASSTDLFDLAAVSLDDDSLPELVVVPYFSPAQLYRGTTLPYSAPYQTLEESLSLNVSVADA
jgi:hypothetical protein